MARFKQVSTGLTLVCERKDVIEQYEKYPDLYIPLDKAKSSPKAAKEPEETKTETAEKAETPKTPEKK